MIKDVSSSFRSSSSRIREEKTEDAWSLFLASSLIFFFTFTFTFTFWILAISYVLLRHPEAANFFPYHSASPPCLELEEKGGVSTIYSMPDKLHSSCIRGLVFDKVTSVGKNGLCVRHGSNQACCPILIAPVSIVVTRHNCSEYSLCYFRIRLSLKDWEQIY